MSIIIIQVIKSGDLYKNCKGMNIESIFDKGYTYIEYRNVVDKLLQEGRTTGNEQTREKVEFTRLNIQRMNRLDKTIHLSEQIKQTLEEIDKPMLWLLIVEAWCGDGAQITPVVNKIAEGSNGKIQLKIVSRDSCPEIMETYFEGSKSIPRLLSIDEQTMEVICKWGPRPQPAHEIMLKWKASEGKISKHDFEKELHLWYARDKGESITNELMGLIEKCGKRSTSNYRISA